jgi:hypothetical protein
MNNVLLMFNKSMENVYEKYDYYMYKLNHDYDFYVENAFDAFEAEDVSKSFENKISTALTKLKDTIIAFFRKIMNEIKIMIMQIRGKKMMHELKKMSKKYLKSNQVPNIEVIQRRYDMYIKSIEKLEKEYINDVKKALRSKNKDPNSIKEFINNKTDEFDEKACDETYKCWLSLVQDVTAVEYSSYIESTGKNIAKTEKIILNDMQYCEKELDYDKLMDLMDDDDFEELYYANASQMIDSAYKMLDEEKKSAGYRVRNKVVNAITSVRTKAAKLTQRKDNMIYSGVKQQFTKVYGSVDNKD